MISLLILRWCKTILKLNTEKHTRSLRAENMPANCRPSSFPTLLSGVNRQSSFWNTGHEHQKMRKLKMFLLEKIDQRSWGSYRKLTFQRLWDFHADDAFTGFFWSFFNAIIITCLIVTWFLPWSTVVIRWFTRMEIYQKSHTYMD